MHEDTLTDYRRWPLSFLARYIRTRLTSHLAILVAVVFAVGCSVGTQYAVKMLVDRLAGRPGAQAHIWGAFGVLVVLIAGDILLWRVAGVISSFAFVGVTGDVRRDLFRYLTGHAPSYFLDRLPGALTSRITATANAVFTLETMTMWNVLPPCLATLTAVALLSTVNVVMTLVMATVAVVVACALFRLAAKGEPLHRGFADHAAAVDGEMIDIVGNMPLVRAFGGLGREQRRFEAVIGREMTARRRSLLYIERVRLTHAVTTIAFTVALLAWAIVLWQRGEASTGDVVLVTTLGFTILYATRDLAVALVDVTQHRARLAEALATILVPYTLRDHAAAAPLDDRRGSVAFEGVQFRYPGGHAVFTSFALRIPAGQRVGLVGASGAGKSTLLALLQRFYDVQGGRVLIDGRDITRITQDSLREAIAVVPQDVSLFHRSVLENIRYGRPEASDSEVLEAAEAAQCRDFIEALPQGINTIVGDRGIKLSGGQRQRLAIARALVKDAPILLLDEATSELDIDSEEAIRIALERLMRGRTVIAVAHRLSTLRDFDRIVVLRAGRIVQDGPPDELLRGPGAYRELVQREMGRLGLHVVETPDPISWRPSRDVRSRAARS
ncbi:MAG TPA: ABC transporter ATP-binding protein [Candidatus Bathyarchaeia archaeon]|nr:ABC transporter ATP-binding protein [Candidatus Bathyarchaeia archaeon]